MNGPRYAIYFAPAVDSPWWRFGAGWLGRDEQRDQPLPQPAVAGLSAAQLHALTEEPRRYGFHATLKAPFRLRDGADEALLRRRLAMLAAALRPVPLLTLALARIDDFVALEPVPRSPAVDSLAARCVIEVDDLRASPTPAELARRRPERLDDEGRALLARYGYPHVLGRFRFHLTLSGPVDAQQADRLIAATQAAMPQLHRQAAPVLDRLCLFREERPGAPFVRVHDEVLAGEVAP